MPEQVQLLSCWTPYTSQMLILNTVFPTVPGMVGTDGRARRPSFIKMAVLWVDSRALQSYWERDMPVGPGRHLD